MALFHKEDHTVAVLGGGGSFQSDHPWRGILWNVIIEPTTSSNTYLLVCTNRNGDEVIRFDQTAAQDPNDTNEALEMPTCREESPYTFTFSSGSIDEDIRVRTALREVFP